MEDVPVERMDLTKKSLIFITGASKGIGQTIAIELARRINPESIFVLIARSQEGLNETKAKIGKIKPTTLTVLTYRTDLATLDMQKCNDLLDDVIKNTNVSDVEATCFFHNAGQLGTIKETARLIDVEDWRKHFDVNLHSAILLNSAFVLKLQDIIRHLYIVNITSLVARKPIINLSMYAAGKAAKEMFFKTVAVENPRLNVLNYSPGPVLTDMFNSICENDECADLSKSFTEVRNTSVLTPTQTVEKLLNILVSGSYQNGTTIDFYDRT
ncbi:hypothetical protein HUJ04_007909 [Dendroctonus ponderosae]